MDLWSQWGQDGQEAFKKKALRQYDVQITALEIDLGNNSGNKQWPVLFSLQHFIFSLLYFIWKQSRINKISFQAIHTFQKKCHSHPSLKFLLGMVGRRASQSHWCLRRLPRPSITSHQLCSYVSDTCALAVMLSCPLPHLLPTHQWWGGN